MREWVVGVEGEYYCVLGRGRVLGRGEVVRHFLKCLILGLLVLFMDKLFDG